MKRNAFLDAYRGFSLVSMLFFHGYYDAIYIFGWLGKILPAGFVHGWQQTIVLSFVFISGAATMYSKKIWQRGLELSVCGLGITVITMFFLPAELIIFGVLSFLGAAFLLMGPFQGRLKSIPAGSKQLMIGAIISLVCFILTQGVPHGYVGMYGWEIGRIPLKFSSLLTFVLGLPTVGIFSADYVPIIPHIFVFWGGRFLWQYLGGAEIRIGNTFLAGLGRHSLAFYLLHQPVLYGLGCLYTCIYKIFLS
ncbi:MAG: DUF1624 domain-containing protein [Acidaminococcaceae bacterium]|jgi:uncharacterized membrane protein|nr:DUF1624 domain-containing protein [Acidaminococcaceae bacterium]